MKKGNYYSVQELTKILPYGKGTLYTWLSRPEFNKYLKDKESYRRVYLYNEEFEKEVNDIVIRRQK